MNVRGDAASRGMTAHDRIRLTGPFAEYHPRRQRQAVGATNDSPVRVASQPGLTIYSGSPSQRRSLLRANALPLPTRRRAGLLYHQSMLRVKLLDPAARAPVVAHPGEDLGYDLFASENAMLAPRATIRVRTGIAVEARHPATGAPLGLLIRDRSSMAAQGVATTGGVIDAGYRGEILVLMTNLGDHPFELKAGEKIAQMVPIPVLTGEVTQVESLEDSARAEKGFGSSGR